MNSEFNIEVRCIKDLWPSNHKKPSYEFYKGKLYEYRYRYNGIQIQHPDGDWNSIDEDKFKIHFLTKQDERDQKLTEILK